MQASKQARTHTACRGISLDDERRRRAASVGAQNKGRHCYGAVEGYPPPPAGRLAAAIPRIASPTANGGAVAPGLALFVFIPFWFPMQQVAAGPSNTCELRPLGDNTRSANSIAVGSSFQITDHAHHIMRSMPSR